MCNDGEESPPCQAKVEDDSGRDGSSGKPELESEVGPLPDDAAGSSERRWLVVWGVESSSSMGVEDVVTFSKS